MNKKEFVRACPEFLYIAAPQPGKERYVFKDRVSHSLNSAYSYAVEVHENRLKEAVKTMFRELYGYSVVKGIEDLDHSGYLVHLRNYRITLEAIDGVESVSDYLVSFDEDWQVTTADEYNRIM